MLLGNFFYRGLEQNGLIGGPQGFVVGNGGFINSWARFSLQAFQRDIEPAQQIKKIIIKTALHAWPQNGIAKHAGRKWLWVGIIFIGKALWRFPEIEPFKLLRKTGHKTHGTC